jgi:hypothetical protein
MVSSEQVITNQVRCARNGVRLRTIALPAEHGGWGLLLEPIVLGLLIAPSVAGVYLALSAVGFFLARHPLTLVMLNRGRVSPRTVPAKWFAGFYLLIGASALITAIVVAHDAFILPLLIAAPLALVQLVHDWNGHRRVLIAELSGAIAISSLAAAIALAGGSSSALAFALWALMIARALPAIVYVRACLGRLHGRSSSAVLMMTAHVTAVAAIVALMWLSLAPRLAVIAGLILLFRAWFGFRHAGQTRMTAKQIGYSEIGFGALTVLAIALGEVLGS